MSTTTIQSQPRASSRKNGGRPAGSPASPSPAQAAPTSEAEEAYSTLSRYRTTEKGNVLFMASAWRERLRYDPILKTWLLKSQASGVWKEDLTDACAYQALDAAAEARRALALKIPEDHKTLAYREVRKKHLAWANKNEEFRVLSASVKYAQKLKTFVSPDLWDRDQFLIGTPTGIYDLHTGQPRLRDSESYISKSTSVAPADLPACSLWLDFLSKAMRRDSEKIAYLKRLAGYSLTGSVREHSLTWFVGDGGNGKSTFVDALTAIYGDYAHPMRTEPLMMAKHDQHPTEICDLKGRRLVIASETDEGRTWRESLLKRLTGGDPITARHMHSDPITFLPTHTLIVSCNSQPSLSSVGESERRRFQILNWDVNFKFLDDPTFQAGDIARDETFNQQLESEYPAILRWAIDGAREWLARGLKPPASIITSSQEYFDEQDLTQQWIEQTFDRDPEGWVNSTDIWRVWQSWAYSLGIDPGNITALINKLKRKGFIRKRRGTNGSRGVVGLKLKVTDTPDLSLTAYSN